MKRNWIVLIVVLLALLAGGVWNFRRVARDSSTLVLYGNVDIREVNLGFRVSGKVAEVLKDEGDTVQPGDIIARLDEQPYLREVAEASALAKSVKARLDLIQAGYRKEEIAQARAVLRERQATLQNAARIRDRKQDLVRRKVVPDQEFDDAAAAHDEAEARMHSSEAALTLLEAGYRPEEISQAEADSAKAEAALQAARLHLEDTVLKAPSGGVVMTRALEPGAIASAGTTVVNLSLKAPVWVRVYVHEPELGRIHPGQTVSITTDTHPDRPYQGQIGFISPRAEFTPKSVETRELRTLLVYRLRVVVSEPDDGLRQGMPVTVRLTGR